MCSVYIAQFISVYCTESLLNLRMHFINNYSALIVTSNTFALPQRSTPVNMNCLSCALKCFEKNMACHLAPKHSLNQLEYECLLTSHDAQERKEWRKRERREGRGERRYKQEKKDVFAI